MKDVNIPLYDIKPPMEMEADFFMVGLSVFCVLAVLWIVIHLMRRRITQHVPDDKAILLERLGKIDLDESKQAAYEISEVGFWLAQEYEELQEAYAALNTKLERYKYLPHAEPMNDEVREAYQRFYEKVYEKIS